MDRETKRRIDKHSLAYIRFIYRHIDGQSDSLTVRHTDRRIDRWTERQTSDSCIDI